MHINTAPTQVIVTVTLPFSYANVGADQPETPEIIEAGPVLGQGGDFGFGVADDE